MFIILTRSFSSLFIMTECYKHCECLRNFKCPKTYNNECLTTDVCIFLHTALLYCTRSLRFFIFKSSYKFIKIRSLIIHQSLVYKKKKRFIDRYSFHKSTIYYQSFGILFQKIVLSFLNETNIVALFLRNKDFI